MTSEPRPTHRELEVDHDFGRLARAPGGVSRDAALRRAALEVERVKPQVAAYITQECQRLDAALRAVIAADRIEPATAAEAYAASQQIRDIAGSVGYALVGLIAANLCFIFETAEAGPIGGVGAVIDCHHKALLLALSRPYRDKHPSDLPELSAGLLQIAKIAQAMAADGFDQPAP